MGATVPGALFGLCVALVLVGGRRQALTLGAVGALAFSMGGTMTYGQTLGLMHNVPDSPTYWWGFLGVAIKGGVWIALGGVILGMVASNVAYPTKRLALILGGGLACFLLGAWLLNSPFDPPDRIPRVYFSHPTDEPRHECWGGLLLGWFWMLGAAAVMRDRFAVRLSVFGLAGGAVGFSVGEMIQAWGIHAHPFGEAAQRWIDWWKVMECFFGACAGAALALGSATAGVMNHAPTNGEARPATIGPMTWIGGLTVAWVLLWIVGDAELLPIDIVLGMPFLGIAIPLLCCFHERDGNGKRGLASSAALCVGAVLLVSGYDVYAKCLEADVNGIVLLAIAVIPAGVVGSYLRRHWGAAPAAQSVIAFVAISQTALTWIKQSIDKDAGLFRLYPRGAALTVEIIFVVLAIVTIALAYSSSAKSPISQENTP